MSSIIIHDLLVYVLLEVYINCWLNLANVAQLMIPIMGKSVAHMLDKWSLMCKSGKVELEVSEWFQNLTEEVITRTIFGGSYDDGKKIYQLQAKQIVFAAESFQKVFIPGYR